MRDDNLCFPKHDEDMQHRYNAVTNGKFKPLLKNVPVKLDLRPALETFAQDMEQQLRHNDELKGPEGWRSMGTALLRNELKKNVTRQWDCRTEEETIEVMSDMANMCMMIADNARIAIREREDINES